MLRTELYPLQIHMLKSYPPTKYLRTWLLLVDRAFKEIVKLIEFIRVGPNPIGLVSF